MSVCPFVPTTSSRPFNVATQHDNQSEHFSDLFNTLQVIIICIAFGFCVISVPLSQKDIVSLWQIMSHFCNLRAVHLILSLGVCVCVSFIMANWVYDDDGDDVDSLTVAIPQQLLVGDDGCRQFWLRLLLPVDDYILKIWSIVGDLIQYMYIVLQSL